jgi:hypothetical protein
MSEINDMSEFNDDDLVGILTCSQSPTSSTVLNLSQASSEDHTGVVVFEDDMDFSASLNFYEEDGDHFILVERNPQGKKNKRSLCDQDGGKLAFFTAQGKFCGEEAPQGSRKVSSPYQPLSPIALSSLPTDNSYALTAYLEDNASSHFDHDFDHDLNGVHWCYGPRIYLESVDHDKKVGDCTDVLMVGAWIKDQRRSVNDEHDLRNTRANIFSDKVNF